MFDYISRLIARKVGFNDDVCNLGVDNVQDAIDAVCSQSVDPFAIALFDDCTPLFDKDAQCNVELLEECG